MNLLRFIPIKLTLLLVLGILAGKYFRPEVALPVVLVIFLLSFLAYLLYQDKRAALGSTKHVLTFGILVALTTITIGVMAVSLTDSNNRPGHYSHLNSTGNRLWRLKVDKVLKSTSFSDRYIAEVVRLENRKASGKLLLSFSLHPTPNKLRVDDELLVYADIDPISPPVNPHQFDYRKYMSGLDVRDRMRLQEHNHTVLPDSRSTVYGIAASFRQYIIDKLKEADFGEEELGIIQALLLGQRNDISPETYENYKNAGAVHMLAVSGLHIGIILLLLRFLLQPLERLPWGKPLKLMLIVALLWGFAFLAGLSPSVVRAVTMFSFVAYALHLNRPGNTFNVLALSMFTILLVIDPMLLFQVGFQMSYAAVFAIVWLFPLLQRLWNPKNKVLRYFWQLLSVSLAAQLGVLPISLFYFHQFPGLFFISNLVIVPALGLILGTGILVIFLALLNRLPDVLVTVYDSMIRWMNSLVGWVARQEDFVFRDIAFDIVQLLLAYAILIFGVFFLAKPNFKKAIALFLAIIGFQLWLFNASYQTRQKQSLFVAHQTKNSGLIHQSGAHVWAMTNNAPRLERLMRDYRIAERTISLTRESFKNAYRFRGKKLLVIDSLGVYPKENLRPDYVLLTGSPRLNLQRLIDSLRPKKIIADGSNYRSYIERWKLTCSRRKMPFHYTGEMGAFYFER
ncbi:ComEC/Rec2 family competence protein [Pricia sp. S334]|uniref:ComEC/Rec2 family competence protein n=1 Tax=Pricia mediterranea TaxID=3076079 RepID=A0ABU3L868_9FLAO|nr:ComEC/Rec2 family competence protein [Pricia sp. S334]MDT7829257.1 ComEC/Rec2 family competence protein [Pricia sp. S334]